MVRYLVFGYSPKSKLKKKISAATNFVKATYSTLWDIIFSHFYIKILVIERKSLLKCRRNFSPKIYH
jgi:hypothetical protein